ncbi:MAG TPA: GntR family transcriptional regulator [Methylomirabilota bacterium]|nr:GntR family transcriptional regulator [Methylomirabilota bacterium]
MAEESAPTLGTSVETVYRWARDAIIDGGIAPGAPLRLNVIARRCAVSAIPVREAFRLLEAEGFLVNVAGEGSSAVPLTRGDLEDVYWMRLALESETARLAAVRIRPFELARLRRLDARAKPRTLADRDLHVAIAEAADSARLPRAVGLAWDHAERYRRASLDRATVEPSRHAPILAALADGDADAAVRAIRAHLTAEFAAVDAAFLARHGDEVQRQHRLLRLPIPRERD